ncbi:TIR domain-containing protein [Actinomycetospora sp. C-140]
MALTPTVFVSYRRDDTKHLAGRLYDRLASSLSADRVFVDVSTIDPGEDFGSAIERAVTSADVVLVLIGRQWLRLDPRPRTDADDVVLHEVRTALRSAARVIPVLVDGAEMPPPSRLPPDIRPLVRRQALAVDHASFDADANALLRVIRGAPVRVPWWRRHRVGIAATLVVGIIAALIVGVLAREGVAPAVATPEAGPTAPPGPARTCTPLGGSAATLLSNPQVIRQNDGPGVFEPVADGVRLTSPLGTDLRTENGSLTTPFLAVPVGGDFMIEAQMQVAPTRPYSAAGLLLARDADNYVRLERGIGSFDAVAFEFAVNGRHQKLHGPFRGDPLPIRTEAVRVGLRLERHGDQVTAWWRDVTAGGSWQALTGAAPLSGDALAGATVLDTGATDSADPNGLGATLEGMAVTCLSS